MGPNHFQLKDGGAVCSLCQAKNPLANLRRMSIQEVSTPSEIIVCFTQGGTAAMHYTSIAKQRSVHGSHLRQRRRSKRQ
jgi:hypothetical protein